MTLTERQCEFTAAAAKLICEINARGYTVKVQEWNRELETQKEYVAKGVSKTMDSRHLDKLAVDLILLKNGIILSPDRAGPDAEHYRQFGVFWESLGGRWGGRFGLESQTKEYQAAKLGWDCDHFEFRVC